MLPAHAQPSYPSPPHMLGKPPSDYQAGYPPAHRGPVQGRPLIFAAMAAAEAEAEIIDPKAWMAVATLDSDDREESAEMPPRTERSDGSSQFVSGYPTPRSTSPKSPEPKDRRAMQESIPTVAVPATGRHNSEPPNADSAPLKEQTVRRPSASSLRSPPPTISTSLPTPPESHPPQPPRTKKLSKSRSRVSRMPDAPPSPSHAQAAQARQQQSPPPSSQSPLYPHPRAQMGTPLTAAAPSATFGAKPPTPVEDTPPPPPARESSSRHRAQGSTNAHPHAYMQQQQRGHGYSSAGANHHTYGAPVVPAASSTAANANANAAAQLGSPIHLRHEKPLPERRSTEPARSPQPPPGSRVISSESPVPTRPVKVLTERQMEKLSATKGLVATSAGASAQSARRRHEQPVLVGSPPSHTRSLPSQSARSEQYSRSRQDTPRVVGETESSSRAVGDVGHNSRAPGETIPSPHVMNEATPATPQKTEKVLAAPDHSAPRSPGSPTDYAQARTRRRGKALEKSRPEGIENVVPVPDPISASGVEHPPDVDPNAEAAPEPLDTEEQKEPVFYPLERHIAEPALLAHLLAYLSFGNWLALSSASKAIRTRLYEDRELTERALERYLRTVGYARWTFAEDEPLALTLEVSGRRRRPVAARCFFLRGTWLNMHPIYDRT
ncbi:hypothetical protein C8Q70DRAFT_149368 [Cubamyces menziesii]|nr:hypothetical protein C8Q70DRAFT_149368 [Cubamyces menziesii]